MLHAVVDQLENLAHCKDTLGTSHQHYLALWWTPWLGNVAYDFWALILQRKSSAPEKGLSQGLTTQKE